MRYSFIGFNKHIEILISYIIEAFPENQLKLEEEVVGKIGSNVNSFKVISLVCGRNDGDFHKMDYFGVFNIINSIFSSRQLQCPFL